MYTLQSPNGMEALRLIGAMAGFVDFTSLFLYSLERLWKPT